MDIVLNLSIVDKIFIVRIILIMLIIRILSCICIKGNTDNIINTNKIDNIGKFTICEVVKSIKTYVVNN